MGKKKGSLPQLNSYKVYELLFNDTDEDHLLNNFLSKRRKLERLEDKGAFTIWSKHAASPTLISKAITDVDMAEVKGVEVGEEITSAYALDTLHRRSQYHRRHGQSSTLVTQHSADELELQEDAMEYQLSLFLSLSLPKVGSVATPNEPLPMT